MTKASSQDEQWQGCQTGEVSELVDRLRVRRRQRHVRQVSVGVVSIAILLLAGVYAIPHFRLVEPSFGGIVCSEVQSLADEYIAGRLDGGTTERVDTHLEACDHCREFIANLRQSAASHRVLPDAPSALAGAAGPPEPLLAMRSR
jgi:hypothetical protein